MSELRGIYRRLRDGAKQTGSVGSQAADRPEEVQWQPMEELEPRMLLSGSPGAEIVEPVSAHQTEVKAENRAKKKNKNRRGRANRVSPSGSRGDFGGQNMAQANPIGVLGQQLVKWQDGVGNRDRWDYYSFTLETDSVQKVTVRLGRLTANARLRILDSNGKPMGLSNQPGRGVERVTANLTEGQYFIEVKRVRGNAAYKIATRVLEDFTVAKYRLLLNGGTFQGDSMSTDPSDTNFDLLSSVSGFGELVVTKPITPATQGPGDSDNGPNVNDFLLTINGGDGEAGNLAFATHTDLWKLIGYQPDHFSQDPALDMAFAVPTGGDEVTVAVDDVDGRSAEHVNNTFIPEDGADPLQILTGRMELMFTNDGDNVNGSIELFDNSGNAIGIIAGFTGTKMA